MGVLTFFSLCLNYHNKVPIYYIPFLEKKEVWLVMLCSLSYCFFVSHLRRNKWVGVFFVLYLFIFFQILCEFKVEEWLWMVFFSIFMYHGYLARSLAWRVFFCGIGGGVSFLILFKAWDFDPVFKDMLLKNFFFGSGLGSFKSILTEYKGWGFQESRFSFFLLNSWVRIWLETGAVGFLLVFVPFIFVLAYSFFSKAVSSLKAACWVLFCVIFLVSCISSSLYNPYLIGALLIIVLASFEGSKRKNNVFFSPFLVYGLFYVVGFSFLGFINFGSILKASIPSWRGALREGKELLEAGEYQKARERFEQARKLAGNVDEFFLWQASAQLALKDGEGAKDTLLNLVDRTQNTYIERLLLLHCRFEGYDEVFEALGKKNPYFRYLLWMELPENRFLKRIENEVLSPCPLTGFSPNQTYKLLERWVLSARGKEFLSFVERGNSSALDEKSQWPLKALAYGIFGEPFRALTLVYENLDFGVFETFDSDYPLEALSLFELRKNVECEKNSKNITYLYKKYIQEGLEEKGHRLLLEVKDKGLLDAYLTCCLSKYYFDKGAYEASWEYIKPLMLVMDKYLSYEVANFVKGA